MESTGSPAATAPAGSAPYKGRASGHARAPNPVKQVGDPRIVSDEHCMVGRVRVVAGRRRHQPTVFHQLRNEVPDVHQQLNPVVLQALIVPEAGLDLVLVLIREIGLGRGSVAQPSINCDLPSGRLYAPRSAVIP